MAITQIGQATLSNEALAYIVQEMKKNNLEFSDLSDAPSYTGKDGKFLKANSGGGSASMSWESLPASGLSWQAQSINVTASDKIGYLASNGITITLPPTPDVGTLVAVADHNSEFNLKPVRVVASGGKKIEEDDDLYLDLRNTYIQLIFDGVKWDISQVNSPLNLQEITEESFPGGQTEYHMSRIPSSRAAILVINDGNIISTSRYSVIGNRLVLSTPLLGTVCVRYVGIPATVRTTDTPVGSMLYFPNNEPVDGWIDCTGGTIHRSVYPDLVRYLTKSPTAEVANIPDARANFIRVFDQGTGLDQVASSNIPVVLQGNSWGRWLDTTDLATSENLWDGNTSTRTTVSFAHKYVGYRFDAPVSLTSAKIHSSDLKGAAYTPTSVQLKGSNDGVTWVNASSATGGTLQNSTITITSTTATAYRYWAVFGTGGSQYSDGSGQYWGVTSLVFVGTSTSRLIGGRQDQSVGPLDIQINGDNAATGQVQSGTGATVIRTGGVGNISGGGNETRPDNIAYVLRIKAFSYQSGDMARTDVTALRDEVSRLSTKVNDGTSYVGDEPPANPSANARWFDTNSGRTFLWFDDGNSKQWVEDSPQARSIAGATGSFTAGGKTAYVTNGLITSIV